MYKEFFQKRQISILILCSFFGLFSLACILNFTDPKEASWLIFTYFYLSIFIFLFSFLSLTGYGIKRLFFPQIILNDFWVSLRQGFFLSTFFTLTVGLQIADILTWWVEILLFLFFISAEIFINIKK